jgi:dihydrofolate reductase
VSLDGFIADTHNDVDWLNPFFSPEMDFAGFMSSIGTIVMGRKTFDIAMSLKGPLRAEGRSVVLTRRSLETAPPGVEAFDGDVCDLVDRIRRELTATGKDIWLMGGGVAIDAFRAAGLVDRLELAIMPVLLGDGVPLFPRQSRGLEGLRLTHSCALKNGVLEVWYEPERTKRLVVEGP